MSDPRIILLFSGKRKSGKDHICDKIKALLGGERCTIVRISGPLKRLYAQNHKLDFQELLSDGPYKEIYRVDMINWSDKIREKDPGYFCKAASEMGRWVGDWRYVLLSAVAAEKKSVWIVSDVRRKTDIQWFKETYQDKIKTVRIRADTNVRESRGFVFTKGTT
jgi:phosphomevalonate kinase